MSTTEPQLPAKFCWSKMGEEAGEAIPAILLRKEWERSLGNGRFYWGIGHSVSTSAAEAAQDGSLPVIFSPMKSKARRHDATPDGLFLWRSFKIDARGTYPLPPHVFLTSGAFTQSGAVKSRQYALVCTSTRKLARMKSSFEVPSEALRNIGKETELGDSQVTAVVSYDARYERAEGKRYEVCFSAQLKAPYCVKLADPMRLTPADVKRIAAAARSGNIDEWKQLVERLRGR
jgi:hypothetical protein